MTLTGISGFNTFGDLLKYLRKRAQLTQRELAIAVGYSEAHISRLEKNQRLPDLATTAALLIPALGLEDEPETAARLMQLAGNAHGGQPLVDQSLTLAHRREIVEVSESSESIPSNLPLQLSSFVGRRQEMSRITERLSCDKPARLITLVGPGGIGKTRLALQTVIELLPLYRDGVWFVDLTRISGPELISPLMASIFGVTEVRGQTLAESLVAFLRSRHALILMDNCEHLIQSAAENVERILRACSHIQVLATSREPLSLTGEAVFRIQPLSLPEVVESPTVIRHDSIRLFIERAQNIRSSFVVTDSNLPAIARICRRLDGMPLAIELAAAATDFLSIGQIEARLDDRFQLLTHGQRTLPRHQTLRATIEWSHDLLDESERRLFRRLSVFAGGWTLEAANKVCAEKDPDVFELLARLVQKSLVMAEVHAQAEARYTMLETIGAYAREKLHEMGESEAIGARHFEYFFTMAEQAEPRLFAIESSIDWAEIEIDNIRAAFAWALERDSSVASSQGYTGRALELMGHIWPLWLNRGYSAEGNVWVNRLLSIHTDSTAARARALLIAGDFAGLRGDSMGRSALIRESLTLARELGDKKRIAWALMEMGVTEREHHYSEAVRFFTESLGMFQELDDDLWICRVSFLLAETHMANGGLEAARSLWAQGLTLCRKEHDKFHIAWGLEGLGNVERLAEHFEQARQLFTESLQLKVSVMDKLGITFALESFAQLATAQQQFKRAATLWGAAEQLGETLGMAVIPSEKGLYTSRIAATREELGEESFHTAWAAGRAMKLKEAIDFALKGSND